MNVLILTPDAVGSTLLQRLVTVYMQFHEYDKPVINLHELTNGLIKYYSSDFNREILGKGQDKDWGYYQTLPEITELLKGADHYKTSRLAHYHIRNRQDSLAHQIPFYRYLDDNFFVISCRRQNIFEHALSWAITKVTKKLNVYSAEEKIDAFIDIYKNQIEIDLQVFESVLAAYKKYLFWCENHFNIGSYFVYEKHLPNIEDYILKLPMFGAAAQKHTWHDVYGIKFDDWNRYHFMRSDIGSLALTDPKLLHTVNTNTEAVMLEHYHRISDPRWPQLQSADQYQALPDHIREECEQQHGLNPNVTSLAMDCQFMQQHRQKYLQVEESIHYMCNLGIITTGIPVKKQTLQEKKYLVKNFQQCLDSYNDWATKNSDIASTLEHQQLESHMQEELQHWKSTPSIATTAPLDSLRLGQ